MRSISLKHLRYFEALARHGHFGRAADASGVSQPALSLQIKELEETIGTSLVERGGRQIALTPLGAAFARRARDILRAVDELGALARASQTPLAGRLGLGVIPTVAPYLLPALVKDLAARHPDLQLRPREAVTAKLLEDLVEGRLDAAIVALPVSEPALVEVPLFEEEFVLVRPAAEVAAPIPTATDLGAMPLLLLEEGHCFRDQAIAYCKPSPTVARDVVQASSVSTLVQMVGAGLGVTLVPEMALAIETRSADVAVARLPPPRPARTIGMAWRKTNPLADHLQRLADAVRNLDRPAQLPVANAS
ncbi:MAG: hydrogen peroxide-inducible genes activator [Geminicoccaceae bacterium]|nr:MAG: hydrogen peroxide-inducible genes activator [Geminicoccaceae bacterium]